MKAFLKAVVFAASTTGFAAQAPMNTHPIPRVVQQDGRYALMVGGAPYLMLGPQSGNSSDWPAALPQVWPAIEYLHANTLETPIYWEQFEPKPGQFDYSQVELLLEQARQRNVHVVLLWLGTWKNGSQHYMPEWMKLDPKRYFRVINREGGRRNRLCCRLPAGRNTEQQEAGGIVFGTAQEPSAKIDGKWIHRQFLRVEEGDYVNGVFQFERILNGDQTDYGLPFTSAPEVLHVSLSTY